MPKTQTALLNAVNKQILQGSRKLPAIGAGSFG